MNGFLVVKFVVHYSVKGFTQIQLFLWPVAMKTMNEDGLPSIWLDRVSVVFTLYYACEEYLILVICTQNSDSIVNLPQEQFQRKLPIILIMKMSPYLLFNNLRSHFQLTNTVAIHLWRLIADLMMLFEGKYQVPTKYTRKSYIKIYLEGFW